MIERRLLVMVGLPRSGKTTWAKGRSHPIVSPDAIRLCLHGKRFWSPAEPLVWSTAMTMVGALFLAGHDVVIVDGCHVSEKRRAFWTPPSERPEPWPTWSVEYVWLDAPMELCIARAEQGGDLELVPVIRRMAAEFEPPGEASYYGA